MSAPTLTRAEAPAGQVASARRVRLLAGFLILAGIVFGLRLVQLQAIEAEATAARAGNERMTTQLIAAPRGSITDRSGQPLAVSVDARDIVADQTLVVDPAAAADQLAELLDVDRRWATDQLTGDSRYVVLAQGISPQVWNAIESLRIPGIFSEPTTAREYPAGALAGNIIGFIGADGAGLAGVESGYDDLLAGTAGERTYERGADGRQIPTAYSAETPATPGVDVRLTLDRDIQWAAERAITAKVRETAAESGTVVVMDPRTGELLALATSPSVDPRDPAAAKPADRGNRAISDVFEPGSTAKLITAAAVIEEGTMTPTTVMTVDDSTRRADKTFRDHSPHPVQRLTLAGIVAKSSNVGMIQSAETLSSPTVLYDYLAKFGIGSASDLDLPGESAGRLPAPDEWSGTTFPTLAFGQGMSVNTVQLAQVFATIANDGVRVTPSMVAGTVDRNGEFTAADPARSERVVSAKTAAAVRTMLEGVVSEEGTAPMAQIPGYRVAGKTGTAQRVDPDCGCYRGYTASFAGLAPADNPQLVVAVVLQDPRRGYYGGRLAGPVFREVMSFALKTKQVPPSTGRPPAVQVFGR